MTLKQKKLIEKQRKLIAEQKRRGEIPDENCYWIKATSVRLKDMLRGDPPEASTLIVNPKAPLRVGDVALTRKDGVLAAERLKKKPLIGEIIGRVISVAVDPSYSIRLD